jgi:hypothetical protein
MGSSTAERVINCPGSVALSARSPKLPPSEAAEKGSAQHALIEHLLANGGNSDDYVGTKIGAIEITEEMAEAVDTAMASAELLLKDYPLDQFIEHRAVIIEDEVFGTGDLWGVSADAKKVIIADHKFGYVEVKPDNHQGLFLAAAAIEDTTPISYDDGTSTSLKELYAEVETFRIAVIQPAFEPAHVYKDYRRDEIVAFRRQIEIAVSTAKAPNAPVVKGDWCKWCPAQIACPLWRQAADDIVDITKHGEEWALSNLAKVLDAGEAFVPLYEKVRERVKHELDNGRKVPGWRLGVGRKMYFWKETSAKKLLALLRGIGFKNDDIVKPISPAQARKLTTKDNPDLEDMIGQKTSAPSLVRDSDTTTAPAIPVAAFKRAAVTLAGSRRHG